MRFTSSLAHSVCVLRCYYLSVFSLEVVQRELILTSQPLGWMCATGFIQRKQTLPLAVRTTDPVSSLAPGILVDR